MRVVELVPLLSVEWMEIQRRLSIGILFIPHDLRVAGRICDRVLVMHKGRIFEQGAARDGPLRPQAVHLGSAGRDCRVRARGGAEGATAPETLRQRDRPIHHAL